MTTRRDSDDDDDGGDGSAARPTPVSGPKARSAATSPTAGRISSGVRKKLSRQKSLNTSKIISSSQSSPLAPNNSMSMPSLFALLRSGGLGPVLLLLFVAFTVLAGIIVTLMNVMWMAEIGERLGRALDSVKESRSAKLFQDKTDHRSRSVEYLFASESQKSMESVHGSMLQALKASQKLRERLNVLKMDASVVITGGEHPGNDALFDQTRAAEAIDATHEIDPILSSE